MGSSKKKRNVKSLYMRRERSNELQIHCRSNLTNDDTVYVKIEDAFHENDCQEIANLEINYSVGNIVIKCHENLTKMWTDAIELICTSDDNEDTILPPIFWSTKKSSTSDKIHLQQTKFKYCGANVNINIYPRTGTIMIQGTNYLEWMGNKCQSLFMLVNSLNIAAQNNRPTSTPKLVDTSSVSMRSITPMNMTGWLEEQELLMSPIGLQMYDEDESLTGDIRDCSINELNMILSSSVTELKRHITPTNRMTDVSIQTCDRPTEYTDMGVQVCTSSISPMKDQETQTDNSPCITGFHTELFPDLNNEHVIADIPGGIPETPWENEIGPTHTTSGSAKVLIIGSSNLKGARARGIYSGTAETCIVANGGDRIEDVRNRLFILLQNKTNLVACTIHAGLNNVLQRDSIENIVTQTKECIMLIRDNCPNCNISICSIPPHKMRSDINKTIYDANCQLAYLCTDIQCTFIDYAQGLVANDHVVTGYYGKYSNIHLNQHGTEILSTYIESHLSTITAIRKKCYGCNGQDHLIKSCPNTSFFYKCNICKEVTTSKNHMCHF